MKITILTLTGQRDKYIDNILAEHLRAYGHEVNVRNYIYAGREAVCYEKPDVIIHPMVGGRYKIDFVRNCKEWGIEVIVRRGEAGVNQDVFESMSEDQRSLIIGHWDYSPYVDLELVWGGEFAGLLSVQGWMDISKIKHCGAFAFDPYFTIERNRNHPRTVLFATGFSTCDCRSEYCECGLPEESDYHEQVYKIHREARDKWITTIKKLYRWFGDQWHFELKVRPGEMEHEYERELGFVKIHPQMSSSSEVLKSVDLLVHSGSTMAIEAHLLNIPSFNYCNVNPDPLVAGVSPGVETCEELARLIGKADTNKTNIYRPVLRQLEERLYGKIDGRACFRAAAHINEHIKGRDIKTNIPDAWPKTTDYLEEGIHLEEQEDDVSFLCPCCRNVYFGSEKKKIARCPYCSMQIERSTISKKSECVLK